MDSQGKTVSYHEGVGDPITQIVAGDAHNLVLTSSGMLYTFGYNNKGQCGLGHTSRAFVAQPIEQVLEMADLYEIKSKSPKWICAAGGRDHSLALSDQGKVYATGNNAKGTLGLPGLEYAIWFSKVHTLQKGNCVKVFAGVDHSFVLLDQHSPLGQNTDVEEVKEKPKKKKINVNNTDDDEQLLPDEDSEDFFGLEKRSHSNSFLSQI